MSESDAHTGSYRVTVRQLEAMVRLGEARGEQCMQGVTAPVPRPGLAYLLYLLRLHAMPYAAGASVSCAAPQHA